MRNFKREKKEGFTLVELLVTIAIIAILVAVSIPVTTSVLASARTSKCSGNLHSIGVGLLAFAGDNDGNFPEAGGYVKYDTTDGSTGLNPWTQQIEPYMGGKGKEVYQCPDSSKIVSQNKNYSYFLGGHAAYAANHNQYAAVNLARINAASELILGGDITISSLAVDDADKDDYTQNPAFGGGASIHRGTVNILFADGHIENVRSFDKNAMTTWYDGPGYDYLSR